MTTDTELIECSNCKCVLNDKNLWVVGKEGKVMCEECYQLLMIKLKGEQ